MRPLLLCLGVWGCCCGGTPAPEAEALVAVPATVAEARDLHDPPAITVTITRSERPTNVGACGSPVCVVLLPMMAWEAAFPPQVDVVDIVEVMGAKVHGEYEPDGDLLWAERTEAGWVKAARLLDLPELGRRLVVEGARAPLAGDGKAGIYAPVSIQSQVDLIADYTAALESRGVDQGHDALLSEAFTALRAESLPLLSEWLPQPGEAAARSVLLARVCQEGGLEGDDLTMRKAVLAMAGPWVGYPEAGDGLVCAVRTPTLPIETTGAFATAVIRWACEGGSAEIAETILAVIEEEPAVIPKLRLAFDACPYPDRQAVLSRLIGDPARQEVLARVVVGDEGAAMLLTPVLDARVDADRALLLLQLERPTLREGVLSRLELHEGWQPNAREVSTLSVAYLASESSALDIRDQQASILQMLSRQQPALRVKQGGKDGAYARLGRDREKMALLFVLGDHTLGPALVAELGLATCPTGDSVVGIGELAARALTLGGCTCDEVDRLRVDPNASVGPNCPGK